MRLGRHGCDDKVWHNVYFRLEQIGQILLECKVVSEIGRLCKVDNRTQARYSPIWLF